MTSNKKRVDPVRLGLAIGAILVLVTLLFCCFNGLSVDAGRLMKAMDGGQGNIDFPSEGLSIVSLSILDLMKGITFNMSESGGGGPITVNGIRAAGILLIVAIIIAAFIVYGIISKKFSYKTLKILAISNAVIIFITGVLILLTRHFIAAEITQIMPTFVDQKDGPTAEEIATALNVKNPAGIIFAYGKLAWGGIAAGTTAIIAAFINVAMLIYAKKNNLEI